MPIYQDLAGFMQQVDAVNAHFERYTKSSLHRLIALLHQNSTAQAISAELGHIPAAKQAKYQAAIAHLRATFPGLAPVVAPAPPGMRMFPTAALNPVTVQAQRPPAPPAPLAGGLVAVPTPLPTQGYNLIVDPDPVTLAANPLPVLSRAEIQRINEAVARTKRAVDLAVAGIAAVQAGTASTQLSLYQRFFGTFDINRRKAVRDNFGAIATLLAGQRGGVQGTLNVIDARNDAQKMTWFAATVRNSMANSTVKMWMGRAFFSGRGDYGVSSDATIVTLVHELAHACFGASDVPTVASGLVLGNNGMPPSGALVCNDVRSDEILAQHSPDLAIRNADNYGQYAWEALRAAGA
jgi:hypothetical protein